METYSASSFTVTPQIELLIDGQGKPIEAEARRLEAKRNNRPMTLQE